MKLTVEIRGRNEQLMRVLIRYSHASKFVRLPTSVYVPKQHFTKKDGAWVGNKVNEHIKKNLLIKGRINEIDSYVTQYIAIHGTAPMPEVVYAHFTKGADSEQETTFAALYRRFIAHITNKGDDSISHARLLHYNVLEKRIAEFAPTLLVNDINEQFLYGFSAFLREKHGNGDNTIGSNIIKLKSFLYWAIENGKCTVPAATIRGFKWRWKDRDIVFHEQAELEKMLAVDLSYDARLNDARNAYLLQCFIGVRHGDTNAEDWYLKDNILRLRPKKTRKFNKEVCIPVRSEAQAIIDTYLGAGKLLPKFSNQAYNELIKEVGAAAGINEIVTLTKGRKKYQAGQKLPKYKLMSSHVARATFICTLLNQGVPETAICAAAGITQSTLAHYAKITDTFVKRELERAYGETALRVTHVKTA